jgi:hypothetical protein
MIFPMSSIEEIRKNYIKAVENQSVTEEMLEELSTGEPKNALFLAYRGAFEGLMAKHVFNPYKKLSYLGKSNKTLEKAIGMKPKSVEIRFLRFSMQHYLPEFLGQSKELTTDRLVILQNINSDSELPEDAKAVVCRFLIESKRCTAAETEMLKEILKK